MAKFDDERLVDIQCKAMGTVFQVRAYHKDNEYAEKAVWAAIDLLGELEQSLSFFIPNSDIARVNSGAAGERVVLSELAYEAMAGCKELYKISGGAFDVTAAGRFRNGGGAGGGWESLQIGEGDLSVTKYDGNLKIDMGGFGKGFAVDKMADVLVDWGLDDFLIHGGSSSVYGVGSGEDGDGWRLSLTNPFSGEIFERVLLEGNSISASGLKKGEHIFDTRKGKALRIERAVWSKASSASISDGLSTAFLILDEVEVEKICDEYGFGYIGVDGEGITGRFNF